MRVLITEKLSERKYKTPEGYLVCVDAVLARTGKQTYLRKELFGDGCDDADSQVDIDRTSDEVFSEKTIASFENKPVVVEHPEEDVNVSNHKEYSVGFARDIRKGEYEGQEVIIGNLILTDPDAINDVENGEHVFLSCGYDCDIENNQQKNIRGNHVALCNNPRAGITRIVDSRSNIDDAGAKVKEVNLRYCVVAKKYFKQYGVNAFVDITTNDLNEAKNYKRSLERNDMMDFIVYDTQAKRVILDSKGDIKMKDAMKVFKFRWRNMNTAQNYDTEVKANEINEAIQKLADIVALRGVGTANANILRAENTSDDKFYSLVYGIISNAIKKKFEDACEDVCDDNTVEVEDEDEEIDVKDAISNETIRTTVKSTLEKVKNDNKKITLSIRSFKVEFKYENERYDVKIYHRKSDRVSQFTNDNLTEIVNSVMKEFKLLNQDSIKDTKISPKQAIGLIEPHLQQYMQKNHPEFKLGKDYGVRLGKKISKSDRGGSPGQIVEVYAELGYSSLEKLGNFLNSRVEKQIGNYFEPDYSGVISTNLFDSVEKTDISKIVNIVKIVKDIRKK